jgi:hypothetical protein
LGTIRVPAGQAVRANTTKIETKRMKAAEALHRDGRKLDA